MERVWSACSSQAQHTNLLILLVASPKVTRAHTPVFLHQRKLQTSFFFPSSPLTLPALLLSLLTVLPHACESIDMKGNELHHPTKNPKSICCLLGPEAVLGIPFSSGSERRWKLSSIHAGPFCSAFMWVLRHNRGPLNSVPRYSFLAHPPFSFITNRIGLFSPLFSFRAWWFFRDYIPTAIEATGIEKKISPYKAGR
ncbi:hypothetical protein BKA57DRAFT_103028 [Linnemannia elongata]|nr:hypothetical protein BKA57DRAFT_103028 [Linnemannia elongata]